MDHAGDRVELVPTATVEWRVVDCRVAVLERRLVLYTALPYSLYARYAAVGAISREIYTER